MPLRALSAGLATFWPVRVEGGRGAPTAAVTFLPRPLRESDASPYMARHQNRREAREMARVLSEMGFGVEVGCFRGPLLLRRTNYDLILGAEPNFIRLAARNPRALKAYYATGAYCGFQHAAEVRRVCELNKSRGSRISIARPVRMHTGAEIADLILQIGTPRTIGTYPDALQSKVDLIRPSVLGGTGEPIERDWEVARRTFLWLGGKGPILKGLDLCLAAFAARPDLRLLVAGDPDPEFLSEFADDMSRRPGVEIVGWLDVSSESTRNVAQQAGFILLPSASEGFAGSVLTGMAYGLIPVTSWIASPPAEVPSIEVEELTVSAVGRALDAASTLPPEELEARSSQCMRYVSREHNLSTFRADLALGLTKLIGGTL